MIRIILLIEVYKFMWVFLSQIRKYNLFVFLYFYIWLKLPYAQRSQFVSLVRPYKATCNFGSYRQKMFRIFLKIELESATEMQTFIWKKGTRKTFFFTKKMDFPFFMFLGGDILQLSHILLQGYFFFRDIT